MARIPYMASFFLFLTKISVSQRQVTVQKGPLFRTVGYPASIGCNVTGHQGPFQQDFQWSFYLPTDPSREIQIISTSDPQFTYAVYNTRVQSGDIYIERLQGNSVLLHISNLQMKDSGIYECHTPSTDERYFGVYSAKTELIVIPDTLSAAMTPQTLHKEEGEPLELTCEASKATTQHTHLSVTWYLMQGRERSQATKIISLSRDFMLIPGPSYSLRFSAGDVGLSKLGATTFRLSLRGLQRSDQGAIFCEATEWIQDLNETWTLIGKKQTNGTTLMIRPAEGKVHVSNVRWAENVTEHGEAAIPCHMEVPGDSTSLLSVMWFRNQGPSGSKMLVHLQRDGLLEYGEEELRLHLHCFRANSTDFILQLRQVELEDAGEYWCEVNMWKLHGTNWVNLSSGQSQHLELTVLSAESTFAGKICSSTWLPYLLTICPLIVIFLLLMVLSFLYWKVKKLST
ncbi:immunoglobulin superfamily member 2 [Sorex fumeus]|uniref:immunoglobulin superfamily member 2 n=1 Tax=Sorex fumeus TaxID=62283 RepID=UPI0024AD6BDE|nr:immunoglobulin superfamily member 2 [Sorex fumeus]